MTAIPSDVLSWVGQAVIGGTLAAVLAWLLTASLFRRARPVVHAAIWTVVLLKFVMPVGPGVTFSLSTALNRAQASLQPAVLPAAIAESAPPTAGPHPNWVVVTDSTQTAALATPVPTSEAPRWSWTGILTVAYLLAVLVIGGRRWCHYRAFAGQCSRLPEADAAIRAAVAAICRRESLRLVPQVRIMEQAPAPFVFGAWRPVLVLSRRQFVRPDELEAVVLHEIAHLRRGDLFVRYLQWCAGTLLFFWPVVAWVNRRIDLARETACDEWALRRSRLTAGDYARCLLRALHPPGLVPAYRPAAMAANLKSVERRIEMIMESPNRSLHRGSLTVPTALFVAAWAAFILAGAASATMSTDEKKSADEAKTETVTVQVEGDEVVVTTDGHQPQPAEIRTRVIRVGQGDGEVQEITAEGLGQNKQVVVRRLGKAEAPVAMAFICDDMSPKALGEFLKSHPTADANADGKLTAHELDAFLVARAMGSPVETLKQFPEADRNKDNRLTSDEAVRLVAMPGMAGMMNWVPGQPVDCLALAGDGANTNIKSTRAIAIARPATPATPAGQGSSHVRGTKVAPAGGETRQRMVVRSEARIATSGDPVQVKGMKMKLQGLPGMPGGAREWLKTEITTEPATAEVARYVSAVENAPLTSFLEEHPDSDTNKDGKLTTEEQMAFLDTLTARMLAKHRPDLDVDGDGKISETERGALEKQGGVRVMMKKNVENINGEVTETESFEVLPDDGEVLEHFEIELEEDAPQAETKSDGGN